MNPVDRMDEKTVEALARQAQLDAALDGFREDVLAAAREARAMAAELTVPVDPAVRACQPMFHDTNHE